MRGKKGHKRCIKAKFYRMLDGMTAKKALIDPINNLEMMNNSEDEEIRLTRIWTGKAMKGVWDGKGRWRLDDKTWNGSGPWADVGGMLHGTWNVRGKWGSTGDGVGDWKGEGELNCNMEFMKCIEHYVIIIGIILSITTSAISYFLSDHGWLAASIIAAFIATLTILAAWLARSTSRGKLWLSGTWEDVGEFRILDMDGEWKLGYHTGVIRGKMKDPKPG